MVIWKHYSHNMDVSLASTSINDYTIAGVISQPVVPQLQDKLTILLQGFVWPEEKAVAETLLFPKPKYEMINYIIRFCTYN